MRHKGRQNRTVLTVNGRVLVRRVRWHDASGARTPADRWLDTRESPISQGVREMACRLNSGSISHEAAAEHLDRCAHVRMSKETLRTLVIDEGKQVQRLQASGALQPETMAEEGERPGVASRLYAGCDGVKVPLITDEEKKKRRRKIRQKRQRRGKKGKPLPPRRKGSDQAWKEFRIVTIYNETQTRREVRCTRGNHEAAGRLMRRMAAETGYSRAQERIAVVDGAPWIRNQIELHGLTDHIGLDYYHLRDNVQKTRLVLFGEGSDDGRAWREHIMDLFYERGCRAGFDALVEERKKHRGRKRAAINRLLGYVAERADMIRYPEFRERGWQIGSGPTEAQCKTATSRIKGRGRRWDAPNAEAVMALACLDSSRAWHRYWTTLDKQTT